MSDRTGTDRTALVTGSSGGIGKAICSTLADRGWHVLAAIRNPVSSDDLRSVMEGRSGRLDIVEIDLTDADSISKGAADALRIVDGRLGAIVHNAGVPGAGFLVDPDTPDIVRQTMETNFIGPAQLTTALLPALRSAHGRVVVISSIAAFMALPGLSAYVASKWALEGWCSALAVELMPIGVTVSLVEPGTYQTAIWENQIPRPTIEPYAAWAKRVQLRSDRLVKRFSRDPKEVGAKVAQLLEADRPRFRNPVGPDAWLAWAVLRLIPPRLRHRALASATAAPKLIDGVRG